MKDSIQEENISFALWVPLIWYALVASRNVSHWLNPGGFGSEDANYLAGSPIDRAVYSTLIVIGIFILFKRKVNWSQILKSNAWIFIFFAYMGFSALWSDFGEVAFKRWVRTSGVLVMVLVVLTDSNPLEAISRLLRRCLYVFLPLSIILIKYFRTLGVAWTKDGTGEMWVGVTTHKNQLGEMTMISGIYFIWNIMRSWGSKKIYIDLLFLLMTSWLIIGSATSRSNTSIFVFFVGLIILLMFHKMSKQFMKSDPEQVQKTISTSIFLIAFVFLTFQLGFQAFNEKSILSASVEASGRDMTFTGRTFLWIDLLDIASNHPILGVGYGSFWIGDLANDLWYKHPWKPGQGHNGFVDVYVELGMVGLFLFIGVIFSAYRNILRNFVFNIEYQKFRITVLSMILLHNITETSFTRGTHNLWFLFLLVAVNVPDISKFRNSNRI